MCLLRYFLGELIGTELYKVPSTKCQESVLMTNTVYGALQLNVMSNIISFVAQSCRYKLEAWTNLYFQC